MPQRLLRPGIRQSKRWNRVGYLEQTLYVRLLTMVDDFGRYEADPELIRSEAFPYGDPKGNIIPVTTIDSACQQLSAAGLLVLYEIEGKKFMQLTRWKERVRAQESRYPAPLLTNDSKCPQMIASPPSPSPSPSPQPEPVNGKNHSPPPSSSMADVINEWNSRPLLKKCLVVSDKRRQILSRRLKDPFFVKNWKPAIRKVEDSPFCLGINDRGWKASFDWFIQPDVCAKIMEGKYDSVSTHRPARNADSKQMPEAIEVRSL